MIQNQNWKIGDCEDLMKELDENSIDLMVTDPPYGYSFMGKDWDKVVPSTKIWKECLRILKPGAFAFIMSAPRQDVLAHNLVNLSDAGFETGFTSIYWTYASGFPKAGNIGKMVDKRLGAEREVIGKKHVTNCAAAHKDGYNRIGGKNGYNSGKVIPGYVDITEPATPQAKELDGSYGGFQPKPAVEVIMVVMKPLSESTYVDQAMTNGKGITWLDDGRIPFENDDVDTRRTIGGFASKSEIYHNDSKYSIDTTKNTLPEGRFPANLLVDDNILNDGINRSSCKSTIHHDEYGNESKFGGGISTPHNQYSDSGSFSRYFNLDAWWNKQIEQLPKEVQGRFPANLLVDDDILNDGNIRHSGDKKPYHNKSKDESGNIISNVYGDYKRIEYDISGDSGSFSRYFDIDNWWHKQIKQLPKEVQKTFPFLITPKASKSEKIDCTHPTVKPVKLFSWLITIGSRKDDLVLDPFLGSGTTLEAGRLTNRRVIGFELDPQWEKLYSKRAMAYQPALSSNWC